MVPAKFTPLDGFENWSPFADQPAARVMVGDDGNRYGHGNYYIFDGETFLFFNGQMMRCHYVRRAVHGWNGLTEANCLEVVPGQTNKVSEWVDGQRGQRGSVTLIWEP